jgi:hypothetical protein
MEAKQLEVIVAQKSTKDGASDTTGRTYGKPQEQDQVGGRVVTWRLAVCPYADCGAIAWVEYDPLRFTDYTTTPRNRVVRHGNQKN